MSVQIQFHINDKFIKFSPDVTTVLSILTKALDILHGNLFRKYERFPKKMALIFPTIEIYIFIYLSKLESITNYKDCCVYLMEVLRRLVDHYPIQFSRDLPIFQTRVLPCIIILKQEFY